MKPLHIIFLFICLIFNQYKASAQEDLLGLLNEVITSIKIQGYNGGKTDSWARVPYNFSDITIKDNILTINYSFKISDGGNHVNGKFVPNIYMHFYTIVIDIPKSILHRSTKEYWHSISISSSEGIKIIKSVKDQYNRETYYVDNWSIEVNSEALESKIYNAFNDIWNANKISTPPSTSSQKGNPSISSKQTSLNTVANEYKYYQESGFAIKKSYKLEENTMFIDAFRQNQTDGLKLVSAYTCFQNAETQDPNYINVINIVVYRIDAPAELTLAEYKRNLIANRFPCSNKTWNGLQGLEYSFKQDMGNVMLPTKAFYGYKGNKFYLIQIGALVDTDKKYNALLNSIKIL